MSKCTLVIRKEIECNDDLFLTFALLELLTQEIQVLYKQQDS